ncbi:hypothetical protein ACIP5Y_21775 [Nocardia sp. NPDC088792]|uniref:hypothetical protein n=1 Tax=Nocardia sp. NPDC088792 TaxID=3364332 RepID=UPI0037F9C7B9
MIKPATDYVGQVIHYNGHDYTVSEGPEYEYCSVADTVNELGQPTLLFLSLDDNGDIARAATRNGPWKDVTVTV